MEEAARVNVQGSGCEWPVNRKRCIQYLVSSVDGIPIFRLPYSILSTVFNYQTIPARSMNVSLSVVKSAGVRT